MKKCELLAECALFERKKLHTYLGLNGVLEIDVDEFRISYPPPGQLRE